MLLGRGSPTSDPLKSIFSNNSKRTEPTNTHDTFIEAYFDSQHLKKNFFKKFCLRKILGSISVFGA